MKNPTIVLPELDLTVGLISRYGFKTKPLADVAEPLAVLAKQISGEKRMGKHLTWGMGLQYLRVVLYLGGDKRVLYKSRARHPLEADCEQAIRIADVATLYFWQYRAGNKAPELCAGLFNMKLAQATADLQNEVELLALFGKIEEALKAHGLLAEKAKRGPKGGAVLAAILKLQAQLDRIEAKLGK